MNTNAMRPFSTKEVARFLDINEKMVYSLISEKGLPATKVTGKWLFPRHLVQQWIENHTINYPDTPSSLNDYQDLLIIAGSNDILLDKTIALFNNTYPEYVAVFGNMGSMGGIRTLRRNLCHIATSHLLEDNEKDYNFAYAGRELNKMPAVINFCRRHQGILVAKGNPRSINTVADLAKPGIRIANRPMTTGTRLLLDREFEKAGVNGRKIDGYDKELSRHMDVGVEILSGRADAGPAIEPIAFLLGLDFIPLRWECYDLLVSKDRFFEKGVQLFLGLLHEKPFRDIAKGIAGYDIGNSGKMAYPIE